MDGEKKGRKTFSLDKSLIEEMDDEVNNASKVVNDLLGEYLSGGREGPIGLEVKLQRTERKLQDAYDDRERINRKIERLRNRKSRLESQIEDKKREKEKDIRLAAEKLKNTPKEPDNPAVQNWAANVGLPPTELLRKIEELEGIA